MKAMGDFLHDRDLLFGLYSSAGSKTCWGRPGSLNHEATDASDFAAWGVDYLAYGNCQNEGVPAIQRYSAMGKALQDSGRNVYYSIRNWGNEKVWSWGWKVADSWRTTKPVER